MFTKKAAHSGFAYALLQEIWYSDPDDPDSILARALALARKGCALDDHDAMGHFILGRILVRRDELTIARAELEKAIERAQLSCSFAGLDLSWHFKACYIDLAGELVHSWRLSKVAFTLAFLKADVYDKESADLQQIIATKVAEQFFNEDFLKKNNKSTIDA